MDSVMTEAELASETVRLFAQELKVLRAQLREASCERGASSTPNTGEPSNRLARERIQALLTENETLRVDNAAFQAEVSRLRDELTQVSSIKAEDGIPDALQYEESMERMREELAGLLAERDDLVLTKEDASKYREKHSVLRGKYKQVKAKAHEHGEVSNELRVKLSNCAQEIEQVKRGMVTEIDFRDFFKDVPYEPVEGQLELASIQPYFRGFKSKLNKRLASMCQGPYFVNAHEVIWSPGGIALGLVVKPTFQYNPKITGGTWTKLEDHFYASDLKQMDVCLVAGQAWHYLGTYERVEDQGAMAIAPDTLQYLDHQTVDYASRRTTLFPDLVPPSQTQMIENMYKKGVIKLQCFAIRCVAFNTTFSERLRNLYGAPQKGSAIPMPATPSKRALKRKRSAESTDHSMSTRSKKKKKHQLA